MSSQTGAWVQGVMWELELEKRVSVSEPGMGRGQLAERSWCGVKAGGGEEGHWYLGLWMVDNASVVVDEARRDHVVRNLRGNKGAPFLRLRVGNIIAVKLKYTEQKWKINGFDLDLRFNPPWISKINKNNLSTVPDSRLQMHGAQPHKVEDKLLPALPHPHKMPILFVFLLPCRAMFGSKI